MLITARQKETQEKGKKDFLMERGKNFGGWKIRFFILEGPFLNCGEHSHSQANKRISLYRSKIIKADDSDDDYRHAFYILENEAKGNWSGTYSKHVLSAETDKDRDEWIEMLQKFVDVQSFCELKPEEASYRKLRSSASEASTSSTPHTARHLGLGLKSIISSPVHGFKIGDSADWPNRKGSVTVSSVDEYNRKQTRRLFFFKNDSSDDSLSTNDMQLLLEDSNEKPILTDKVVKVFGSKLAESVAISSKETKGHKILSIVYRSIQLLEYKNAVEDEGIFRISGSSSAIENFREAFDYLHDVDLIEANADIHAATGLLKLFLRHFQIRLYCFQLAKYMTNWEIIILSGIRQ